MKKVFFILVFALGTIAANAQSFQRGSNAVNVGVGFGTGLSGLGNARPAISASYERGIWDIGGPGVISLGGYVGNTGYKYELGGDTYKWNYTIVGARGAYHYNGFTSVPKLDLYGGVMLSYNIASYSFTGSGSGVSDNFGSDLGFNGFVGGRWFFSDNFGAFAELGFGVSNLNVGVAFKF